MHCTVLYIKWREQLRKLKPTAIWADSLAHRHTRMEGAVAVRSRKTAWNPMTHSLYVHKSCPIKLIILRLPTTGATRTILSIRQAQQSYQVRNCVPIGCSKALTKASAGKPVFLTLEQKRPAALNHKMHSHQSDGDRKQFNIAIETETIDTVPCENYF